MIIHKLPYIISIIFDLVTYGVFIGFLLIARHFFYRKGFKYLMKHSIFDVLLIIILIYTKTIYINPLILLILTTITCISIKGIILDKKISFKTIGAELLFYGLAIALLMASDYCLFYLKDLYYSVNQLQ